MFFTLFTGQEKGKGATESTEPSTLKTQSGKTKTCKRTPKVLSAQLDELVRAEQISKMRWEIMHTHVG